MRFQNQSSNDQKVSFFNAIEKEMEKLPFGTLGKRDLECLILHNLIEHGFITSSSNRAMANALGINETRLKGYLVDIRYKFKEDNIAKNVQNLIRQIFANDKIKVVHDKEQFIFAIENPVIRIDFEQAMKDVGYYTDTSFNKEIVKVKDFALVAFLFRFNNEDNTFDQLKEMQKAASANEKDLVSKLDMKKSWLEIGKDIMGLTEKSYQKIVLLRKIALFLTTGNFV